MHKLETMLNDEEYKNMLLVADVMGVQQQDIVRHMIQLAVDAIVEGAQKYNLHKQFPQIEVKE